MDLAERVLVFLSLDKAENDMWVISRQSGSLDDERKVHMLGEDKETARRRVADKSIADRPDMKDAVRLVVKFSADAASTGGTINSKPINHH